MDKVEHVCRLICAVLEQQATSPQDHRAYWDFLTRTGLAAIMLPTISPERLDGEHIGLLVVKGGAATAEPMLSLRDLESGARAESG